ncbi:MAG: YkgJ family cysteine cluster protein [Labilithrix sp.]|nr:YkgJ family cysteine cluster protein [Labilithrix sp.]
MDVDPRTIDWVEALHGAVDELVRPIAQAHGARLSCRSGCSSCCTDGLSVFEIEAAVIARHHADLLENGAPHEEGACAFLDGEGACTVYAHRPYVCRTQGLPLRWLDDEALVEARDVCPKNLADDGTPLEELAPETCWTLGPFESRLASRQAAVDGGEGRRVPLRSLFREARRHLTVIR